MPEEISEAIFDDYMKESLKESAKEFLQNLAL